MQTYNINQIMCFFQYIALNNSKKNNHQRTPILKRQLVKERGKEKRLAKICKPKWI